MSADTGLVLTQVTRGSAMDRAGLRAGDVLTDWTCTANGELLRGRFDQELDLRLLEWEVRCPMPQTVRAIRPQIVSGSDPASTERSFEPLEVEVPVGNWGGSTRPRLRPDLEAEYSAATSTSPPQEPDNGPQKPTSPAARAELLQGLSERTTEGSYSARWLGAKAIGLRSRASLSSDPAIKDEAAEAVAQGWRSASLAEHEPRYRAWWLWQAGRELNQLRLLPSAHEAYAEAFETLSEADQEGPLGARLLLDVATSAGRSRPSSEVQELFSESLDLYERVAPQTWGHASTLNNAANNAPLSDRQKELRTRALELRQRLAPDSLATATSLSNFGLSEMRSGDLDSAEQLFSDALERLVNLGTGPPYTTGVRVNLALIANRRGHLARAEELWSAVMPDVEEFAPRTANHATVLQGLATTYMKRGELQRARAVLQDAVRMIEEIAPNTRDLGRLQTRAATLEQKSGNLDEAETLLQNALRSLGSDSGNAMLGLATLAQARGDLDLAAARALEALDYYRKHMPGSSNEGKALMVLGQTLRLKGDLEDAEPRMSDGLKILEARTPRSKDVAMAQRDIGRLRVLQGRNQDAIAWYVRSLATFEERTTLLGGTEDTVATFRASLSETYQELVRLLLDEGLVVRAFAVLEAWHGESLRIALSTHDFNGEDSSRTPSSEAEIRLRSEYDKALEKLMRASTGDETEKHRRNLAQIRTLIGQERTQRSQSTGREALRSVSILSDPDNTVFLASQALVGGRLGVVYSVGSENTLAFIVDESGSLHQLELAIGLEELSDLSRRFALLLAGGNSSIASAEGVKRIGSQLYDHLVRPLDSFRTQEQQLTLVLDGPLHDIAFGALFDNLRDEYLIEQHAISIAPSISLANQMRRGPTDRKLRFAGFGNPALADNSRESGALRFFHPDQTPLALPHAATETRTLGSFFESPQVYLGSAANENSFQALPRSVEFLHFATHAFVDPSWPMESAILLSPTSAPENATNGLLQAWEIVEADAFDARLVSLSACDTARGSIVAGEGVLGLAWAFQVSGAQSVMATLWSVPDESTSHIMQSFYRHLAQGEPPSTALRSAQIDALRGLAKPRRGAFTSFWNRQSGRPPQTDPSEPFAWAGFQIYGADV